MSLYCMVYFIMKKKIIFDVRKNYLGELPRGQLA